MLKAQLTLRDLQRQQVKNKIISQGRPICITNMFVDKPCFVIILGLLALLGCGYYTYTEDLFTLTEDHSRQYLIDGDQKLVHWDMQTVAEEFFMEQRSMNSTSLRTEVVDTWSAVLIYKSKNGKSLLDQESLKLIEEMEGKI